MWINDQHMRSTWGLSQIWLQVIEESRFCFNPTNTLPIHLSNSLDEVPPRFNFFCCNEPIWLAHHSKKIETMEPPQKRRFYFEVYGSSHLAHLSIYEARKFVLFCLYLWDPPNQHALDSALGLFGKLSRRRGASAWFHDVWTCGAKVLEYWMISSLKIKLNRSWKFQRNWNVPLILLERSWWAGFNGIYLVRLGFRMWEILI
jgi:hypothetical protein